MRKILFRAKSIQTGRWISGYYFEDEDSKSYIGYMSKKRYIPDTRDWDIVEYYENNPTYNWVFVKEEVVTETVGQYTGLTDKNGTKIFEGDIISKDFYTNHKQTKSKRFNGVVEYKVRCGKGFGADGEDFKSWAAEWSVKFDFGNYEQKYRSYSWGLFFDCEVIGNIYDNPELIEK